MATPLEGIRVLDMSRILAGPWATQTMGDMGASISSGSFKTEGMLIAPCSIKTRRS